MGFSLKKALKSVAKVATAPARVANDVTRKTLDVTGVSSVAKAVGIDTDNLLKQQNEILKGNIRTGSDEFKTMALDSIKVGAIASGVGGAISGATALGGFSLASKLQQGGGANLSDIASLAGVGTSFGGVDLGGIGVINKKKLGEVASLVDYGPMDYSSSIQPKSNKNIFIIAGGLISIVILFFAFRRRR